MKLKKRRHFNNARGGRMTVGSVTLFHQQIPREKFEALPEVQRYCFLLLGHIHNEISWLQRMAYIASRSGSHLGHLEGSGNMMQATFLARLLLGKLFEFQKVLRPEESPIRGFIGDYFRPTDKAAGATQVATILAHYESEEWIALARNKHFLHYPTLGDARPTLNDPNIEWHVEIAHGKKSSNTFYPTSDFMANYSWLRLTNSGLPVKALKHALKVERILAALTLSTLEQSIGHFVDTTLMHLSDHEVVKIRMGQSIHDMRLNYFVKI